MEYLSKSRACYLAVKRDPLVLCITNEEFAANMYEHLKSDQKEPTIDDFFSFLPQKLIYKFNADKANDALRVLSKKYSITTSSRINHSNNSSLTFATIMHRFTEMTTKILSQVFS